ncbi:Uncharacterized protein FKW44_011779 [Caligus rogercresseyi]|uniref:Uncharacterized protein n=1 Tax=Caligus rogercresseyi TaxID=217165 RepID=A0A7T8KAH4_CALRO|nr:Uncharacterized protein FKW44_011779 [Caligus rogercresseyi]
MVSLTKYICLVALIGSAVATGGPSARNLAELLALPSMITMNMIMKHAHHEEQAPSEARLARQGAGIDKVVMVEETEYDEHIECHHSYSKRCHTTFTTGFQPQQEEECEENFKKDCFIEFKKIAVDETILSHTLVCEGEGPEECKTVYESECETRYHEHDVEDDVVNCETIQEEKCEDVTQGYTTEQKCTKWPKQVCTSEKKNVKKYSPDTKCKKVPRQLCGPPVVFPNPDPRSASTKRKPSS